MIKKDISVAALLLYLLVSVSCSVKEKPEFLKIDDINISESNREFVVITGNAFFNNINHIGGELKLDKVDLLFNKKKVAQLSTEKFDVPPKDEFTIPLTAKIAKKELLNTSHIQGILGSLLTKKIEVSYQGDIIYSIVGFSYTYNLNEVHNINIKL